MSHGEKIPLGQPSKIYMNINDNACVCGKNPQIINDNVCVRGNNFKKSNDNLCVRGKQKFLKSSLFDNLKGIQCFH